MGTTAQIEKTIMSAHAALDGEIGGYRRIKTARNQGQHAFLRAQRIAAQPLAPAGQHVQGIGLNFQPDGDVRPVQIEDRKSTRLNSSHVAISYAVFCLKKKNNHDAAAND